MTVSIARQQGKNDVVKNYILTHNTFIFQFSACNILMLEDERLFTMSNDGQARNCTVTSVFTPPNLKLKYFQIGTHYDDDSGLMSPVIFYTFFFLQSPR